MGDEPFNYSGKLAYLRGACIDARLQRTAIAVAAVLIDYADKQTGRCYPSIARIVRESRVPKTTTIRALRRLEECGWLVAEKRNGAHSNYTLTSPETGTGATVGTGANWNQTGAIQNLRVGRTGSDTGTEAAPVPEPEQENSFKAIGKEQGTVFVDRFADFWKAYPRKAGKAKAAQVWKAKRLDKIADQVLTDVIARVADPRQWTDPTYIPHPTTYLNHHRWEDEWKRTAATSAKPSVADDFRGKTYTGTALEDLPESLRPAANE